MATGCLDSTLKIYDVDNNYELKTVLEGPTDEIRFIDWHPKGNVILGGSADNSCWMWNALKGEVMATFFGHEKPIT